MNELLRLILSYSFYEKNKHRVVRTFFPSNLMGVYDLICATHEKLKRDLTISEVKELYKASNPAITQAAWEALCIALENISSEISEDVAEEVLQKAWITEMGRRIAEMGIELTTSTSPKYSFADVRALLDKIDSNNMDGSEIEPISSDIEDILQAIDVTTKWHFNIPDLHTVAKGIGPGIFTIIFARNEVGKSGCWISLCCSPGGFAEQGALVHAYCNEEPAQRSQGRAVMSYTGMKLTEIVADPESAKNVYSRIRNNIKFFSAVDMSIHDLEGHVRRTNPDIIVLDQLDKFSITGSYAREDQRLGALYIAARNIGIRHNCAPIAITQASADAEGKTNLNSALMAESRTAKAAEGDLIIGLGKTNQHAENVRVMNMIKNKITGNHTDVIAVLQPELSRFVA